MKDLTVFDIFNKRAILERAIENWNSKPLQNRKNSGKKYHHIFAKRNISLNKWESDFEDLNRQQQNLLIKGEIIRTYDSLPNSDKSIIKRFFCLKKFATKWFKLSSCDKNKILHKLIDI